MNSADGLSAVQDAQVAEFGHRVQHLMARKQMLPYREHMLIVDCWWPDPPPDAAVKTAAAGASGGSWCPHLRPDLRAGQPD
jgi:hypothetical protein